MDDFGVPLFLETPIYTYMYTSLHTKHTPKIYPCLLLVFKHARRLQYGSTLWWILSLRVLGQTSQTPRWAPEKPVIHMAPENP